MIELGGIYFPEEAVDWMRTSGGQAYAMVPETNGLLCSNCDGMGFVAVQVAFPPGTKSKSVMVHKGGRVSPSKTKQWPCPLCQQPVAYIFDDLLRDSGLSDEDKNLSIDYPQSEPGREHIIKHGHEISAMLPNPTNLYTFFGGYGTGKTSMMRLLVYRAVTMGVKARYVTAEQIVQEMQMIFDPDDPTVTERTKAAVIRRYMKYKLLCVDEIDRVSLTESASAFLFDLLNGRYDRRRTVCTIIATNKSPSELGKDMRFAYLADRLNEGIRVPVGGKSFR